MSKKLTYERFLKEQYEKADRYFTVYDHYRPNYFRQTVTGKFYAKHDALDLFKADMEIVNAIKTAKIFTPRDKYHWPVTQSHRYGFYDPLVYIDRFDERFYQPKKQAAFITHEILLKQNKTMNRK